MSDAASSAVNSTVTSRDRPITPLWDVIVIGAGPAGAEAAATAAEQGLNVLVIDESPAAGGQVYRQASTGAENENAPEGAALRHRLASSRARFVGGCVVWNVSRATTATSESGFEVSILGPEGVQDLRTRALIVASGATERFYARPGWTLPGVLGLGAATVLVKSFGVLPGRRVVIAGAGPLLSLVAHLVVDGGGTVAGIADLNPLSSWLKALPSMLSRPDLLARGLGWQWELTTHRVPVYRAFDVERISGTDSVSGVTLKSLRGHRTVNVEADAVCMGHGLIPSTDIHRLLGAKQIYRPEHGGWVPALDDVQRTSVGGLYAAGDGARLMGAAAAPLQGRMAALAAAFDLRQGAEKPSSAMFSRTRQSLERAGRFGVAMGRLCGPQPEAMRYVPDDTIVCRCEDVTAGSIRAAVKAGSRSLDTLKSTTRCGMGPCGGRSCGASASALMQCSGAGIEEIGQPTARPPLRPLSLAALAGDFAYSDIPLPEPSPV